MDNIISELFTKGYDVGTSNLFKITWHEPLASVESEQRVEITIKSISPPIYHIQNIRNGERSVFNSSRDGVYKIINTTIFKALPFKVSIKKVPESSEVEPLYTIEIEGDAARRGGNSLRHVSRKRKSSRHVSNKKYSMGRRGRSRRVRRVRRSRKN